MSWWICKNKNCLQFSFWYFADGWLGAGGWLPLISAPARRLNWFNYNCSYRGWNIGTLASGPVVPGNESANVSWQIICLLITTRFIFGHLSSISSVQPSPGYRNLGKGLRLSLLCSLAQPGSHNPFAEIGKSKNVKLDFLFRIILCKYSKCRYLNTL